MSDEWRFSALDRFQQRSQQPGGFAQAVQQARPGAVPAMPEEYRGPELVKEAPATTDTGDDTDIEVDELKSYGLARGRAGQVHMLQLRQRSGDCEGVPYAYINRVRFNASGEIQIVTGADMIVIEGRNLSKVFQGLMRHAVVYVQELSRGHDEVAEGEPFVDRVSVEAMEG